MAYEQKEGDIAIFKVQDVEGNRPQWTGKALIDGKERDVSLWIKSDTMLAGQIKDKWVPNGALNAPDEHNTAKANGYQPQDVNDDIEDSIPF